MKRRILSTVVGAVALALVELATTTAAACGPYEPPSEEEQAASVVWRALHAREVGRWVARVSVRLRDEARAVATIHYANGRRPLRLVLRKREGRWRMAGAA
jgi:hypothetical protein